MDGVVRYLKSLGVQNVGRFVSRLPPVLGYDVNTNLAPKVRDVVCLLLTGLLLCTAIIVRWPPSIQLFILRLPGFCGDACICTRVCLTRRVRVGSSLV